MAKDERQKRQVLKRENPNTKGMPVMIFGGERQTEETFRLCKDTGRTARERAGVQRDKSDGIRTDARM